MTQKTTTPAERPRSSPPAHKTPNYRLRHYVHCAQAPGWPPRFVATGDSVSVWEPVPLRPTRKDL